MARAKNTDRAEARRRHRELTRAASAPHDEMDDDALESDLTPPPASSGVRGMFQMPDVREDLRILPGMLAHSRKLWIPFVMLFASFILAVLLVQGTTNADGTFTSVLPSGIESIVSLYVQLTLPPTALFVFFIGGFLAPRASYLVGAVLGLVDGILWSLLFLIWPTAQLENSTRMNAVQPTDVIAIIMVAVLVGILAAGFASWYRNFLRSSQERARQNRALREQQQRLKAKEEARLARSAARQPNKLSGGTSTSSGTTPPSKR